MYIFVRLSLALRLQYYYDECCIENTVMVKILRFYLLLTFVKELSKPKLAHCE